MQEMTDPTQFIFSKTPYRISLFGGGSDYPSYYNKNGGACIGGSINKYSYLGVKKLPAFFEHKFRIVYSKTEETQSIKEIQHPSVREVLKFLNFKSGLEIHHHGDLPARSGLGTSSAFTVGLLKSMYQLVGKNASNLSIAKDATLVEQDLIQEAVGSQDQLMVAKGGFNHITFSKDSEHRIIPLENNKSLELLSQNLLLLFTGVSRDSFINAKKIIDNIRFNQAHIKSLVDYSFMAMEVLKGSTFNPKDIGDLLDKSWKHKKSLADSISTPLIDQIYQTGIQNGAYGGKILGAGGGGFILFCAPPQTHSKIIQALPSCINIDFAFEQKGTRIVIERGN